MTSKSNLRLLYDYDHEPSANWKEAIKSFPNHVPRFDTKDEAIQFTKKYCLIGSNPDDEGLFHSITTLTNWSQIEKYVLPVLRSNPYFANTNHENNLNITNKSNVISPSIIRSNRFYKPKESSSSDSTSNSPHVDDENNDNVKDKDSKGYLIYNYLYSRLNLPIHKTLNFQSTINTFQYLFHHMRCGIFIAIRQQKVLIFCPFVNQDYTNNWGEQYPEVESFDTGSNVVHKSKRRAHLMDKDMPIELQSYYAAKGQ